MRKSVSLIFATKNDASLLSFSLSKMNLHLPFFDNVLVYDCLSEDNIEEVCTEYKVQLISESDTGIYNAWNNAIKNINSDYCVFLGAGDYLSDSWFIKLQEFLYLPNLQADFIFFNVCIYDIFNNKRSINGSHPSVKSFKFFSAGYGHPGSLHSCSILKKLGFFNEKFKIASDFDLILRAHLHGASFHKIDAHVFMLDGGVSTSNLFGTLKETRQSLVDNSVLSSSFSTIIMMLFYLLRFSFQRFRSLIRNSLRSIKHLIMHFFNAFEFLLPFAFLRNIFFRCLGFVISTNSSIGYGFSFYSFGRLIIGDNSVVNRDCLFDNRDYIIIGNNVNIARNVKVFTGYHDIQSPFFDYKSSPVNIENNVVILNSVIVNPGCTLRNGVVVLPGSVISGDTEEYGVYGGIPAKLIKKRNSVLLYKNHYIYPLAM